MTNYEWIKSLSKGDMLAFLEQVWCSGFNDAQPYRDDDRVCAVTGHESWDKQNICLLDDGGRVINDTRFVERPEMLWRQWINEEYSTATEDYLWPANLAVYNALKMKDDDDYDDGDEYTEDEE